MEGSEVSNQRLLERRRAVVKEALRAKNFSKEKLFLDAINFVEEGLKIAKESKMEGDSNSRANKNQP